MGEISRLIEQKNYQIKHHREQAKQDIANLIRVMFGQNEPEKENLLLYAMVSEDWTIPQLKEVIKQFVVTHRSTRWMPADFFHLKNMIYGEDGNL